MTLKRMDNVLIVVDDLEAAKAFFVWAEAARAFLMRRCGIYLVKVSNLTRFGALSERNKSI